MGAESIQPRVILVPFPAQGHVTPMLNLARAIRAHGFHTVLAVPDFIHCLITGHEGPADQSVEFVSIASGPDDATEPKDFVSIVGAMENYMPAQLEKLLKRYESIACVVVDLLASWAIPVAERSGSPVAGFWPAMTATYRLISAIPELMQEGIISDCGSPLCERLHHQDITTTGGPRSPGKLLKLSSKDLPWLVGNPASRKSRFTFWLQALDRAKTLQTVLINSFPVEEGQIDEHSLTPLVTKCTPQVLQIGPLLNNDSNHANLSFWDSDSTCIEWLDKQAPKSVIYVSFGSWVGPIGTEKINELALGLEATNRPFLWVLKKEQAWQCGLPNGYVERVAERGKIVHWAPQEEVLRHGTIGCYITHCGWNSTVEAIHTGKRLLCYPIAGDQFINCTYIVQIWRIGIELNRMDQSTVRDCVEKAMIGKEAEEMQERVNELRQLVMEGEARQRVKSNFQFFVNAIRN